MQHYGLATRLLDRTEGSLIGLYFAIRYADDKSNPCVWVLDPHNLNHLTAEKQVIFYTDMVIMEDEDEIVDNYLIDTADIPKYPIAIILPYTDKRMSAQKSCFTIHGKYKLGFEDLYKEEKKLYLIQLKINKNKSYYIKRLVEFGITEATLFPDLEGLAREIRFDSEMDLT